MAYVLKNKFGCFGGMVYHAECGWHAGFGGEVSDSETIIFESLEQAKQQAKFLAEMFHEKGISIVDFIESVRQDKEVLVND